MGRKRRRRDSENVRIYPDSLSGRVYGTYRTQAITDNTHQYPETGVARPDDDNVKEGRDWVNFNQK